MSCISHRSCGMSAIHRTRYKPEDITVAGCGPPRPDGIYICCLHLACYWVQTKLAYCLGNTEREGGVETVLERQYVLYNTY